MKEPLEKIADVLLFRRTDGLWVLGGDDTDATYNNQGNAIRSYFRRIGQSDKVRRVLKNTWEYSGTASEPAFCRVPLGGWSTGVTTRPIRPTACSERSHPIPEGCALAPAENPRGGRGGLLFSLLSLKPVGYLLSSITKRYLTTKKTTCDKNRFIREPASYHWYRV